MKAIKNVTPHQSDAATGIDSIEVQRFSHNQAAPRTPDEQP